MPPKKLFNKPIREALDQHFRKPSDRAEAEKLIAKFWRATRKDPKRRLHLWVQLQYGSIIKLRDWIDWALTNKPEMPSRFLTLKAEVQRIFDPIDQAGPKTSAPKEFLFTARKAKLKIPLPSPEQTYLLLVELLGYKNIGHFEKILWSVPLDVDGRAFLVEHRKLGLGIFIQDESTDTAIANQIARKINRACRKATPFFEWHAQQQAKGLRLNVHNKTQHLFNRYKFFLDFYSKTLKESTWPEQISHSLAKSKYRTATAQFKRYMLTKHKVEWLALAAIDAFFSYTEHVFIHIAIMQGKIITGDDVLRLANADWPEKFKTALDIREMTPKMYFDKLVVIRRQLRNFVAHGAFGKKGEAFEFHSPIGAIPVTLTGAHRSLGLSGGTEFDDKTALKVIEEFIAFLWTGERELMKLYIQNTTNPLRPASAKFGEYAAALQSRAKMKAYIKELDQLRDNATNMDF